MLGYTELISIHEDILLLFCSGTAARLDLSTRKEETDKVTSPTQASPRGSKVIHPIDIPQASPKSNALRYAEQDKEKKNNSFRLDNQEKKNSKTAKTSSCRSCHIVSIIFKIRLIVVMILLFQWLSIDAKSARRKYFNFNY